MGQLLDEMIKNVNKKYKDEIMSFGQLEYNYERIPFSSPRMNYCTYGGIPKYKLTELFGVEYGGKTTTALDIVANYQHMGETDGSVLYIDAENRLDKEWAEKIGVDITRMYIIQPKGQSAEDIFQMIEDAVTTNEVGLWLLDSIGMLLSSAELDPKKDYEDKTYAGISGPLTRFSKKIEQLLVKHKCTGVAINQVRDNLGSVWGGLKTPGGKAFRHACSMRVNFRRGNFIDEKGGRLNNNAPNPAGNIVEFNIEKTTVCKPDRRIGSYTIMYNEGIAYLMDLVEVALEYNIIDQHGAWFTILDPSTGEVLEGKIQGQAGIYSKLEQDEELLTKVEELVNTMMKI